ncbi:uncharacterized protein LOC107413977 isoform X2 [Ziziphus jujuba]|uniref:ADP,ATP carrier protein n=1 Tax=Ziziphus jujuba TaxID=326968 RepID=A0ABM4AFG5_ZIZJJ|nr:uncharacterized protein LOC107413977 isoform X2 [Ziziphus jujuba]
MSNMMMMIGRSRLDAIVSIFVSVHPHETSCLLHSSLCFFFILSSYFVVLPLRDEGAISLGLSNLPGLFMGSLALTLIAAPISTLIFSLPNLSKGKALVLIHRFFSVSLVVFFILWYTSSSAGYSPSALKGSVTVSSTSEGNLRVDDNQANPAHSIGWENHGWFYISVRIGFFLWVALLNLITISSTWARIIDVMDTESGSRLFGFIGAGATLGQLFGSLFATGMAWMGPFLLLVAALLMEFAAQLSKGINQDVPRVPEELSPLRKDDSDQQNEVYGKSGKTEKTDQIHKGSSPKSSTLMVKPQLWAILDGLVLIMSSTYLLYVSLFLWLSAVVSSFFYFQGRILTVAGVTTAICSSPIVAFSNLVAIAVWPTWLAVAISETLRKVVTYVVTRPGRELLFTVVSQDEKCKAKVCIDVFVQRLGDATAAGMYKLLFSTLNGRTSTASLYALPVCLLWIATAFRVGRRQEQLSKLQTVSTS